MHLPPYIPAWPDLRPFVAELWLVATAVAVLLVPFFVRKPNTAAGTVTVAGLAGGLASLLLVGPADGGRFAPMLAADGVAFLWKVLLLGFTLGVVLLWFATTRHDTHEGDGPEFFLLLASATLGMALIGSAANLLMVFVAVELASLPSYVLAGFRKAHRPGAEASLKYVLFGAAASSVMVWGLSLVYGVCGTLNLYSTVAADGARAAGVAEQALAQPQASALLLVGLLAVLVGLGFKVSAVPFHLWCPDVFEGAAIDVTTFLSVASKGAGLVLTLRFVTALAEPAGAGAAATPVTATLAGVLGAMAVLTCTIGNTAAYAQTNLKRLLAYSSIAHAGYMLCAVAVVAVVRRDPADAAAGGAAGAGSGGLGSQAAQALLFYLAVYLFMNLGAFAVVAVVGRAAAEAGEPPSAAEHLRQFSGLGRRAPVLAAALTVCLFSLIGVPPLAGFAAKFNLMRVLGSAGGWGWTLLAAVAVNTLLSIYYYAKVVRTMYLEDAGGEPVRADRLGAGIGWVSAAALVLLFVGANGLTRATTAYANLRTGGTTDPAGAVASAAR